MMFGMDIWILYSLLLAISDWQTRLLKNQVLS